MFNSLDDLFKEAIGRSSSGASIELSVFQDFFLLRSIDQLEIWASEPQKNLFLRLKGIDCSECFLLLLGSVIAPETINGQENRRKF
jgi:hypothetical protein